MANFAYVYGKGRAVEFAERVNDNDPAASELVIMLLAASGIESDSALEDSPTFVEIVDGTTNEATNTGYAKKVLGDGSITITYDTTNNRNDLDIADQTWTAMAGDGTGALSDLVTGFDVVGSQTHSDIVPISQHDFAITPDGSDITAQINVFYRAS
jgi:hypothetical protein